MKIAIIGLPTSGKSTIFNVLTESNIETSAFSGAKSAPNVCTVKVPDERVEKLSAIFNPKKKTPAEIVFEDFVGIVKDGAKKKESLFSEEVKQADALVHVVRIFEDETIPHPSGAVDPVGDAETLELELIMADLIHVDNRLSRIEKELNRKKTPDLVMEKDLMPRLKEALESEIPIRQLELTPEEEKLLRGYCYLSQKPIILLANYGEDQLDNPPIAELEEFAKKRNIEIQPLCGKIEMEISQMTTEDQQNSCQNTALNYVQEIFLLEKHMKC